MARHNNNTTRQRTALFDQPQRVHSPYERPPQADYSNAQLASMESQSNEEVNSMFGKIGQLKDLSLRMGAEIRDSNKMLETMDGSFAKIQVTMKRTMNNMITVARKSGIPLKVWAAFFALLFLCFFYIWIR